MASTSENPKPRGSRKLLNPDALPFFPHDPSKQLSRSAGPVSRGKRLQRMSYKSRDEMGAMGPNPMRVCRPKKKLDHVDHNGLICRGNAAKWVPKNKGKKKIDHASSDQHTNGGVIPFPLDQQNSTGGITTVMVKNIPNQFRRGGMLQILKSHCREQNIRAELVSDPNLSQFDFVYLPMDFNKYWNEQKTKNLGYAFVNFTTAVAAQKFYLQFHNQPWNVNYNRKTCEVTCAKIQGKAALIENFKNKTFWCHSQKYLPVVLSPACDGAMVPREIPVGILGGAPSRKSKGVRL